ncbi:ABC transporter ATP-binding protein [Cohaesibacter celericrescens]|uniref:ABC transporter ATP-binding protein n=1 Tax=Cohaesibacter celericrescens TaxID=2067669 RepID=A0A2N5XK83_9HYPH|nr:ATP-binding cassette domain-containing protein [Cohaesibacter celericrescens]PLW74850.1 ABC transporter ATP-binding protein [Cohaesibacter celericrescens]
MLTISNLHKSFHDQPVLRGIDLKLEAGEIVGLIGRSGSGKSTLGRCMVGLETAQSGEVLLQGQKIVFGQVETRRRVQYLWQDPVQALSPFLSAHATVLETLNGFRIGDKQDRNEHAGKLLDGFGITKELSTRRPHMLSGGQCQRVAMARAVAAQPDVLILDEPFSSLDLVTQLSTMQLLERIHATRPLTILIISHDLAPLLRLCKRIAVLDQGRIAEELPKDDFLKGASHALSRAYVEQLQGGGGDANL